jgi:hypothetical protein
MQDLTNHPLASTNASVEDLKEYAPLALTLIGALSVWNHKFLIIGLGSLYYLSQKKG